MRGPQTPSGIVALIIGLIREERPLQVFGGISVVLAMTSLTSRYPLAADFLQTGLVPRLPTAVLASAIMLPPLFSLFTGLVLHTVAFARREPKRLTYLHLGPPSRRVGSGSTQAAEHRSSTGR